MICCKPYVQGLQAFPCGQCDPCLISRTKVWSHRIYLESLKHAENSFVTLTQDDAHLPSDGSLSPLDLQLWLKRFRKAIAPKKIRYFAVGEYGDRTERPHYHLALFGCGPEYQTLVCETWGRGHVMLAELNISTAKYVAGYVTKKYGRQDLAWLKGRHPEFTRMSNRPGIGALAMPDLAAALLSVEDGRYVALQEDVPTSLEMDGRQFPLGRYLRRKLREELGLPPGAPPALLAQWKAEMCLLLTNAFGPASHTNPWSKERIRSYLIAESKGAVANITAKFTLLKPERNL